MTLMTIGEKSHPVRLTSHHPRTQAGYPVLNKTAPIPDVHPFVRPSVYHDLVWFSFGKVDIAEELRGIHKSLRGMHYHLKKIGFNMASIADVRKEYREYAQELKDARDAALALAKRAVDERQEAIDALQKFQDDDAATDATQLIAKQQEDADAFASDLKTLKDADLPQEPTAPPQAGDGVDEDDTDAPVQPEQPVTEPETPAEPARQ